MKPKLWMVTWIFALSMIQPASGQETAPLADGITTNQVREAVDKAVQYLRDVAGKDEEGWFSPPHRNRKVVDHKEVEVYYTRKKVKVPVYEYKMVEQYRTVTHGDSVGAVGVREKVMVKVPVKQIGTREEEKLVRDPKGEIHQVEKRPVYGPGGADYWNAFSIGHNALAMYALMEAGVDPGDEIIANPAGSLRRLIEAFGLPDSTWDLAWITAAFSMMPGQHERRLAEEACSKLLDGQIESGPAAGLWGPVSINTRLLAEMLKIWETKSAELSKSAGVKAKDKVRAGGDEAIRDLIENINQDMKRVMMMPAAQVGKGLTVRLTREQEDPISVTTHVHNIYNQTSADLESTAVAMYALRVAARNKTLPRETWRPFGEGKRPILPPKPSSLIITTALRSIARYQEKDGAWTEVNLHQPLTEFSVVKTLDIMQTQPKTFVPLASPVTVASIANGFSALVSGWNILGSAGIAPVRASIMEGAKSLKNTFKETAAHSYQTKESGPFAPYDSMAYLRDLPTLPEENDPSLWQTIIPFLIESQKPDGSWSTSTKSRVFLPSSVRARMDVLPSAFASKGENKQFDRAQAYVPVSPKDKDSAGNFNKTFTVHPPAYCTSLSLVFLTGHINISDRP
jgi:hypothetical protein